ncbi:G2/mitotic-specific cyclin-B-like isoform X1 [Teleopsis dalmanni]|uniref:G2/mitotic-specific cyclin-B-like isoform X1 n=1 Tax=Teleopsis dalmanni TaxID=139649 RepID=UPI0018CDFB1D|nr:G2/mitotic-specific cyclin-B-like isoform X1 [Teleopsis dalmanni]
MSAIIGVTKINIDENDAEKYNKTKKAQSAVADNLKRAALGDLQNRAVLRPTSGKDAVQKSTANAKLQGALRGTKARVDSNWKKTTLTSSTTNVAQLENNNAITQAIQRRVVTRSSSVRVNTNVPVEQKPKTLPTKAVENKQAKLEVAKVRTTKVVEKAQLVSILPKLRREDSQLSQISLNKIKAAILRDANKVMNQNCKPTATAKVNAQPAKTEVENAVVNNTAKEVKEKEEMPLQDPILFKPLSHSTKLLSDVEDIDADDTNTLILLSEYVNDIYDYLYSLEIELPIAKYHLEGQEEVSPKMRGVLVDWINEVHLQFHLVPETFQMTVAIIDRYLQNVKDTKRSQLQLVGVTALFIATKYEELYPPALSDFVYITDDTYNAKQILQMELKVFKAIDCNLSRPLPIHFLRRYSKAAKAEDSHHTMAKYFLELILIEYEMASYKPSEIAAAALFLALHLLNGNPEEATGFDDSHWTPTLVHYSRLNAIDLHSVTRKVAAIARRAPNIKLKAVYTKYQSSKFDRMSLRTELYSPLIDSIICSD